MTALEKISVSLQFIVPVVFGICYAYATHSYLGAMALTYAGAVLGLENCINTISIQKKWSFFAYVTLIVLYVGTIIFTI